MEKYQRQRVYLIYLYMIYPKKKSSPSFLDPEAFADEQLYYDELYTRDVWASPNRLRHPLSYGHDRISFKDI